MARPPNHHSRDFSPPRNPPTEQVSTNNTRRTVRSTPSAYVAQIAQHARDVVQNAPPPFFRHTVGHDGVTDPSPLTLASSLASTLESQQPLESHSLHTAFKSCRNGDLPEQARINLIRGLLPRLPSITEDFAIHDECFGAILRIEHQDSRDRLIDEYKRSYPNPRSLCLPRAQNGPWRKWCKDLADALAHQWTQSPGSAPRVLATVRRLSTSLDGNDANTVERQFLLLRDLLSRIDPSQRAACLADLRHACDDAIQDARMPASGPWSTATQPALVGLRSALQALSVIHLESGIPGHWDEFLLTEWMVALHVESIKPEEATLLFRRIRIAYRTRTPSTLDDKSAPPLSPLFRQLFALHGLAQ